MNWKFWKRTPKPPIDIGQAEVTVVVQRLDGSTESYVLSCVGYRTWYSRGECHYRYVKSVETVVREFLAGTEPIHIGDGVYIPRDWVVRYEVGERKPFMVER